MEPLTKEEDRRLWREALRLSDLDGALINRRQIPKELYEQTFTLPEKSSTSIVPHHKRQVELVVDGIEQIVILDTDQAEKWDAEIERYERQRSSLLLVSNKQQREYRLREAAREHEANKRQIAGLLSMWERAIQTDTSQ